MNNEKTPLVQKLILGVLTLILVCLVMLIAQNRGRQRAIVSEAETAPATAESEEAVQPVAKTEPAPTPRVVSVPRGILRESTPAATAPETATRVQPAPQPTAPQPYVTLVSPAQPQPLDIVVHPQTEVLKTELCGRVRLEGQPPPEVPIRLDASCSRLTDGPVTTRHYVVGEEGGLANVLVYIKQGLPTHYNPPPINAATVTVSRCFYEPYVVGMLAGQKLTIVNEDKIMHNVHGTAKLNKGFNFAMPQAGQVKQHPLGGPEVFVRLTCDVHPWQFSYVGVVANPFFSVTDTNGVFCLPAGLPHGRYVLAAVHVKAGETLREIVVGEDNSMPIELAFTVPRR
jgi:hypothetical protein